MLEIIAIVIFYKRMGALLRGKGWENPIWMQILVIVLWIGGMLLGGFAWSMYIAITKGVDAVDQISWEIYPVMYISALLGVGMLFFIAKSMPSRLLPGVPPEPIQ